MSIIIIGAGLAGLACARLLAQQGREVMLLEASDGVGGRVRSDAVNGYILDRGFQVLFDSYPAVQRNLDLQALQLQRFDPGALIADNGRHYVLTDPLRDRDPGALLRATLTLAATPLDKLRVLQLALSLRGQSIDELLAGSDTTTLDYLRAKGFSERIIDNFFRPFYGGIFLDRSLQTSAKCFKFDFKMLSEGSACVPNGGMGRISAQLAAPLVDSGCIRLQSRVVALQREGGRVVGVRLDSGEELRGDAVVIATTAPEATKLSGLPTPSGAQQTVALYFYGAVPLYTSKKIILNASPEAFINNAQLITNIAPSYAPEGRHLLSAVVLGVPPLSDEELFARAFADLRLMFAGNRRALRALNGYAPLRLYRIPYAQFSQLPGIHPGLPDNRTDQPGLYFAAEFTEASSINAAIISGEKCAAALVEDLRYD